MSHPVIEKLDLLKKTLHPEKQMNIINQCEIVQQALAYGSPYENSIKDVATFLEISENKVYKMSYTAKNMIPELKEWFRTTEYESHTAYEKATLPPSAQHEFLRNMRMLVDGHD